MSEQRLKKRGTIVPTETEELERGLDVEHQEGIQELVQKKEDEESLLQIEKAEKANNVGDNSCIITGTAGTGKRFYLNDIDTFFNADDSHGICCSNEEKKCKRMKTNKNESFLKKGKEKLVSALSESRLRVVPQEEMGFVQKKEFVRFMGDCSSSSSSNCSNAQESGPMTESWYSYCQRHSINQSRSYETSTRNINLNAVTPATNTPMNTTGKAVFVQNLPFCFPFWAFNDLSGLVSMKGGSTETTVLLEFEDYKTASTACESLDGQPFYQNKIIAKVVSSRSDFDEQNSKYELARQIERFARDTTEESRCVIIFNIGGMTTEEEVVIPFLPFGLQTIDVFRKEETTTFAIIGFDSESGVLAALALNGMLIDDHPVQIFRCSTLKHFIDPSDAVIEAYLATRLSIASFFAAI